MASISSLLDEAKRLSGDVNRNIAICDPCDLRKYLIRQIAKAFTSPISGPGPSA
jgi:hypothetical protein